MCSAVLGSVLLRCGSPVGWVCPEVGRHDMTAEPTAVAVPGGSPRGRRQRGTRSQQTQKGGRRASGEANAKREGKGGAEAKRNVTTKIAQSESVPRARTSWRLAAHRKGARQTPRRCPIAVRNGASAQDTLKLRAIVAESSEAPTPPFRAQCLRLIGGCRETKAAHQTQSLKEPDPPDSRTLATDVGKAQPPHMGLQA